MKSELSTFERRMGILSILMNQRLISCPELARRFRVSDDTITRDISVLSRFAPIGSKIGRYGGVYIINEYKRERVYLTREEEMLIEKLVVKLSGKNQILLQMILYKFAMPKVK